MSASKTIIIREGDAGLSAYQVAVENGFAGTEAEWLEALQGGQNGWSPQLGVIEDGERRVHQIRDWTGGTGLKPAAGAYLGLLGPTTVLAEATDIRGTEGAGTGGGDSAHASRTDNPHSVTKAQVGLANVDNTADINKPVSTAQAADATSKSNAAQAAAIAAAATDATTKANAATSTAAAALATHAGAADPHPQYTTTAEAAAAAPVQSVAGRTGAVVLAKADVGLGSVDNTADSAKPVSTAQAAALASNATADRDRANHTGSQLASTISDFAATARTQVEAELIAGANVTITPAGSGATRTLTIAAAAPGGGGVTTVAGRTGDVVLAKADVGLANVDNTADSAKPVSTAQAAALASNATADRDRANHTGSQPASTISDFVATARTQVEAELIAGANVTITPAGAGATRTLTVAAAAAPVQSVAGRTGVVVLAKADVGLGSVDNTADSAKPVSTAQAAAIAANATADRDRANHTGSQPASTISDFVAASRAQVEAELIAGANVTITPAGAGATRTLTIAAAAPGAGGVTTVAGRAGDVVLAKADVGLSNVDNTSDANKPVSTAQAAAIAANATADRDRANHTGSQPASTISDFDATARGQVEAELIAGANITITPAGAGAARTLTVAAVAAPVQSVAGRSGVVVLAKADVGLTNVDNTADSAKPVSTAQAAAIAANATADRDRANHAGSQPASTISDFAASSRAQIEGALLGGANITLSYLGSGATRQIQISATGGSGTGLEVSGVVVAGADPTGALSSKAAFNATARQAAGLAADGTGTVLPKERCKMTLVPAGIYTLDNWMPTDAAGKIIPLKLWAFPGTVILQNTLSPISGTAGKLSAIDYDATDLQRLVSGSAVSQQFTAIGYEFAPATFGFSSASTNDERVSVITVSNAAAYRQNGLLHLCSYAALPFSVLSSGELVRVAEVARILNIDTAANKIYLSGVLRYHEHFEPGIPTQDGIQPCWVHQYDESAYFECHNIEFRGAPTTVGITTATPDQLDLGVWGFVDRPVTSMTKSGNTVTVNMTAHGYIAGNATRFKGANEAIYNGTRTVASVVNPNQFTFNLGASSNQADDGTALGAPSGYANTATGTIVCNDAFKPGDLNNHNGCVNVRATVNPQFYNCKVTNPWCAGFRIMNSPEWRVIGGEMRGLPNAGTQSGNLNGGRLGYGVLAYGPSNLGLLKGMVFRNGRHPFTTDEFRTNTFTPNSTAVGNDGVWHRLGGTTTCDVIDCEAVDSWGIPWDTHEGSRGTRFLNNRTRTTLRGPQGGSYAQFAYQIRGSEAEITNGNSEGTDFVVRFNAVPQFGVAHRISGNSGTDLLRFGLTFVSKSGADVTYTVDSAPVAVAGIGTTGRSTGGPHLRAGETCRIRGANEHNYNVDVGINSYDEATRTLVVTLPTIDDRGATFTTAPSAVGNPTGTLVVYPMARSEQVVNGMTCGGSIRGSGAVISNDAQTSFSKWRYKTRVTNVKARRVMCVIASGAGTQCVADDLTVSQLFFDSSRSTQTAALIYVTGQCDVLMGRGTIDCTDNMGYAGSISAGRFAAAADAKVVIGELTVVQHPTSAAFNRIFSTAESVGGNPRYVGLGKLNYVNPGRLTDNVQVIEPGKEALFSWTGGGEEIYLPIRGAKVAVGASEAAAAYKRQGSSFIVRKWQAATRTAAAAAISVDVKSNGTTIFGASKMTIPAAGTHSDAGTIPTYSKTFIAAGEVLTVDTTCTGTESAQGLEVTAVGWAV